jgi:ketosteroid isomerase-like protein
LWLLDADLHFLDARPERIVLVEKEVMREHEHVLRGMYDAFTRRDLDALLEGFHPEIEIDETEDLAHAAALLRVLGPRFVVLSGNYRGREEVRRLAESLWEISDWFTAEPQEFIAAADCIIVALRMHARAKGTGLEGQADTAHVWTMKDGKGRRLRVYADTSKAHEAAQRTAPEG